MLYGSGKICRWIAIGALLGGEGGREGEVEGEGERERICMCMCTYVCMYVYRGADWERTRVGRTERGVYR